MNMVGDPDEKRSQDSAKEGILPGAARESLPAEVIARESLSQGRPTPGSIAAQRRSIALSIPDGARERIRNVLRGGGLTEIDYDFEDWETVLSQDPFEVLYLDHAYPELTTPTLVRRHFELLLRFWNGKISLMQRGAAGAAIVRKYGGEHQNERLVASYPERLRKAFRLLETPEGIESERVRLEEIRREIGADAISEMMNFILANGEVEVTESRALFAAARRAELRDHETAEILHAALVSQSFKPETLPSGATLAEQLQSVTWYHARRSRRQTINPFKFEKEHARSVKELIDLCDMFPDEAMDHLFADRLGGWLSSTLGEGALAREATRIMANYRRERRRGLEIFVRTLAKNAGAATEPTFAASPPRVDLGEIPAGATRALDVTLRSTNGRWSWGSLHLEPDVSWMSVTPAFEGIRCKIEVALDTLSVAPGKYAIDIVAASEPSRAYFRIPVEFEVVAVAVAVDIRELAFGSRVFGTFIKRSLLWTTAPSGGRVVGTVTLINDLPGVTVTDCFDGETGTVELAVDTRRLMAGERHSDVLSIRAGDQQLMIPISLEIPLNRPLVARYSILVGCGLAILAWLVRGMLLPVLSARLTSGLAAWPEGIEAYVASFFLMLIAAGSYATLRWVARRPLRPTVDLGPGNSDGRGSA